MRPGTMPPATVISGFNKMNLSFKRWQQLMDEHTRQLHEKSQRRRERYDRRKQKYSNRQQLNGSGRAQFRKDNPSLAHHQDLPYWPWQFFRLGYGDRTTHSLPKRSSMSSVMQTDILKTKITNSRSFKPRIRGHSCQVSWSWTTPSSSIIRGMENGKYHLMFSCRPLMTTFISTPMAMTICFCLPSLTRNEHDSLQDGGCANAHSRLLAAVSSKSERDLA